MRVPDEREARAEAYAEWVANFRPATEPLAAGGAFNAGWDARAVHAGEGEDTRELQEALDQAVTMANDLGREVERYAENEEHLAESLRKAVDLIESLLPAFKPSPERGALEAGLTEVRAALSAERAGEPPTPEEIERAAEAMWTAGPTTARPSWEALSDRQRDFARHEARAALDAARQPEGER